MYHQVLIELNEKNPRTSTYITVYEFDVASLDQVYQDVLMPYLKGDSFEFDGQFISKDKISRLKVFRSEMKAEYYAEIENAKVTARNVPLHVSRTQVIQYSRYTLDVTKEVIKRVENMIGKITLPSKPTVSKEDVFIVHGHDGQAG